MRPVTLKSAQRALDKGSVLLLDPNLVGLNYFGQLLALGSSNVTTKQRRVALPLEIWIAIVKIALDDILSGLKAREGRYKYVQAVGLQKAKISDQDGKDTRTETGSIYLSCCSVDIINVPHGAWLANDSRICAFEVFLKAPEESPFFPEGEECDDIREKKDNEPIQTRVQITGNREEPEFRILIASTEGCELLPSILKDAPLFSSVSVADVISIFEGGDCGMCGGTRLICPGCGRGPHDYGVFMSCGVTIGCPVCIGLDFALDDKDFLQAREYEGLRKSDRREFTNRTTERLKELGYLTKGTEHAASFREDEDDDDDSSDEE